MYFLLITAEVTSPFGELRWIPAHMLLIKIDICCDDYPKTALWPSHPKSVLVTEMKLLSVQCDRHSWGLGLSQWKADPCTAFVLSATETIENWACYPCRPSNLLTSYDQPHFESSKMLHALLVFNTFSALSDSWSYYCVGLCSGMRGDRPDSCSKKKMSYQYFIVPYVSCSCVWKLLDESLYGEKHFITLCTWYHHLFSDFLVIL